MRMRIQAAELQAGDELESGVFLEAVYNDIEGVWVQWSDGDQGYVDHSRKITIYR